MSDRPACGALVVGMMVMKARILETWMKQNGNGNLTEPQDSRKETALYSYPVIEEFQRSFFSGRARRPLIQRI
ncbi:MAG: hypothetical protein OXL41_12345 [Nitrospinae bacterium]|nr:hypothetical protein [Nitrospinota bacterium]